MTLFAARRARQHLTVMFCAADGSPVFPTWYRWGYGWNFGRNYAELDEVERKLADDKLSAYRVSGKRSACE